MATAYDIISQRDYNLVRANVVNILGPSTTNTLTFQGSISGIVLTVTSTPTSVPSGGSLQVGQVISATGVTSGTIIIGEVAVPPGTPGVISRWTVSVSQTVATRTMTAKQASGTGYGQTINSRSVEEGTIVGRTDWEQLKQDIINIYTHQVGTSLTLSSNVINSVIKANVTAGSLPEYPHSEYIKFFNGSRPDDLLINKFKVASSQAVSVDKGTRSEALSFTSSASMIITVEFPTAKEAREFFNSGSEIRFSSASNANATWQTLLSTASAVPPKFGGNVPQSGTTSYDGRNYYRLTNTLGTAFFTQTSGSYTWSISARAVDLDISSVDNRNGTAKTIEFSLKWESTSTTASVGTFTINVTTVEAFGALLPTGTFRVTSPQVTYSNFLTYQVTATPTTIYEKANPRSVSITISSNQEGAISPALFWVAEGGVTAADFAQGVTEGVINSLPFSLLLTAADDILLEGNATFVVNFRRESLSGTIVAATPTITIIDDSVPTTYSASATPTTIYEVASPRAVTATLTSNVTGAISPSLYWTADGGVTAVDFSEGVINGTISSLPFSVTLTAFGDTLLEGTETFTVNFRKDSISGTVVASTPLITIIDDSVPAPTFTITSPTGSTNVNGNGTITINFSTTNYTGLLYWRAEAVSGGGLNVGNVVINSSSGNQYTNSEGQTLAYITGGGIYPFTSPIRGEVFLTNGSGSITLQLNVTDTTRSVRFIMRRRISGVLTTVGNQSGTITVSPPAGVLAFGTASLAHAQYGLVQAPYLYFTLSASGGPVQVQSWSQSPATTSSDTPATGYTRIPFSISAGGSQRFEFGMAGRTTRTVTQTIVTNGTNTETGLNYSISNGDLTIELLHEYFPGPTIVTAEYVDSLGAVYSSPVVQQSTPLSLRVTMNAAHAQSLTWRVRYTQAPNSLVSLDVPISAGATAASVSFSTSTIGTFVTSSSVEAISWNPTTSFTSSSLSLSVTPQIGSAYQGGYYVGIIVEGGIKYYLIVAPKATGQTSGIKWKTANTAGPAATQTLNNGPAASSSMNSAEYPAALFCEGLTIGGYSDWYLPSRDELELCYRNLTPTNGSSTATRDKSTIAYPEGNDVTGDTQGVNRNSYPIGAAYTSTSPVRTTVTDFISGGPEAFNNAIYWTSSEFSTTLAWRINFDNGVANGDAKTDNRFVRAVRRVRANI